MDLKTLQNITSTLTGFEMEPEDFEDALKLANAIEASVISNLNAVADRLAPSLRHAFEHLDRAHRMHAAVVAWRDKHKLVQGGELTGAQVMEVVVQVMQIVGWYQKPVPALATRPLNEEEAAALADFEATRRASLEAEGNTGLKP